VPAASEDAVVVSIKSLFYTCTSEFQPAIIQQLEEEDIARLARHAEAKALYQVRIRSGLRLQSWVQMTFQHGAVLINTSNLTLNACLHPVVGLTGGTGRCT
jgi:hypothetical protein